MDTIPLRIFQCLNGVVWGLIFAMIVLGLSLTFGLMNLKNVAHGSFLQAWRDGSLFQTIAMPPPRLDGDRLMVCGSPLMLADFCQIMDEWGFR